MAKSFALEETTIDQIHDAYRGKTLTCVELVQGYLDRIAAYDQKGPALNAFVALNADALTEAAALDAAFQRSGKLSGPLHGIPIAVKDQAETKGIPTSFGSRVDGVPGKNFLTFLQHWSGAVTCPAC